MKEKIGDGCLQYNLNLVQAAGSRDAAEAVLVFVCLLKCDAYQLGEILLDHADAKPPLTECGARRGYRRYEPARMLYEGDA